MLYLLEALVWLNQDDKILKVLIKTITNNNIKPTYKGFGNLYMVYTFFMQFCIWKPTS